MSQSVATDLGVSRMTEKKYTSRKSIAMEGSLRNSDVGYSNDRGTVAPTVQGAK